MAVPKVKAMPPRSDVSLRATIAYPDMTEMQKRIVDESQKPGREVPRGLSKEELHDWLWKR